MSGIVKVIVSFFFQKVKRSLASERSKPGSGDNEAQKGVLELKNILRSF